MDEEDLERVSGNNNWGIPAIVEVVPQQRRSWATELTGKEQAVLRCWFKERPVAHSSSAAVRLVAKRMRMSERDVLKTIRKSNAETEAKKQKAEITEAIYAAKIPTAKEVVGYSLESLAEFVKTHKPQTWDDAQKLTKIATDMQMLLRLELGQSTQNIELVTRTQRDVTTIIQDLSNNDPFVDYPAIEGKVDESG